MNNLVLSLLLAALWLACAAAGSAVEEAPAARGAGETLDEFIARMDARAEEIETLEADLRYARREEFRPERERVSTGKIYVRKPSDMYIEFTDPYPRRIWITDDYIVDYKVDLNSAEKVELADENRPEIIGLSTRFSELKGDFRMELARPGGDHPSGYILTLTPAEGVEADFTSASVEVDAESLLPVRVTEKNSRLKRDKIYTFTNIRENPRLSDRLFTPDLRRDTSVTVHEPGDWKGP